MVSSGIFVSSVERSSIPSGFAFMHKIGRRLIVLYRNMAAMRGSILEEKRTFFRELSTSEDTNPRLFDLVHVQAVW